MQRSTLFAALVAALAAMAAPALAQPTEAPSQFAEAAKDKPEELLTWNASLGLVYASGNTNSWTLNAGTQFRIVRGRSAFSLDWTFAYGRADLTPNDDTTGFVDTVRNSNARARYDFYVTRMDAFFAAVAHRWDTFAGLDTRLQAQVGYLRNFIMADQHRLWGEIGYDYTYDNFDPEFIQDPATEDDAACDDTIPIEMRPEICQFPGSQNVHAARAYIGYDNKLNAALTFSAGLEALFNLQQGEDIRLNFDAALTSTLSELFKLEIKFKLLFDNVPVPGNGKYDSLLTVNLVFAWEQEQPEDEAAEGEEG